MPTGMPAALGICARLHLCGASMPAVWGASSLRHLMQSLLIDMTGAVKKFGLQPPAQTTCASCYDLLSLAIPAYISSGSR